MFSCVAVECKVVGDGVVVVDLIGGEQINALGKCAQLRNPLKRFSQNAFLATTSILYTRPYIVCVFNFYFIFSSTINSL